MEVDNSNEGETIPETLKESYEKYLVCEKVLPLEGHHIPEVVSYSHHSG